MFNELAGNQLCWINYASQQDVAQHLTDKPLMKPYITLSKTVTDTFLVSGLCFTIWNMRLPVHQCLLCLHSSERNVFSVSGHDVSLLQRFFLSIGVQAVLF